MPLTSSPIGYPSSLPQRDPVKRKRILSAEPLPQAKRRLHDGRDEVFNGKPQACTNWRTTSKSPVKLTYCHDNSVLKPRGPFLDDNDSHDDDENEDHDGVMLRMAVGNNLCQGRLPLLDSRHNLLDSRIENAVTGRSRIRTASGKVYKLREKNVQARISYERLIAERSTIAPGKAKKSFYGINIHDLLDQAAKGRRMPESSSAAENRQAIHSSNEASTASKEKRKARTILWTEKYRAKKFTELVGDERTHRAVLRWLKGWDPIVFPGTSRSKSRANFEDNREDLRQQQKILMLAGPPGLGKTTLVHVCARQAGYEVIEINASDERNRDVVNGKIKDCVGSENVKCVNVKDAAGTTRKAGKPVCVVVDEVDGVVSGSSGGGEGGFIRALIDLVMLDQKNSNALGTMSANVVKSRRKGDRFRLLRPIILICNDVYHPALRPLRSSLMAEVIHVRRPSLDKVAARLKSIFDREGVACDGDGVRRLCEATWGVSNRREIRTSSSGNIEGDMRGILIVGEWVAAQMRASLGNGSRLTKKWVEEYMIENLAHGGGGARGTGRGGVKETAERVFLDGAGFPKVVASLPLSQVDSVLNRDATGVSELAKRAAMDRLREMVDTSGETDRIVMDCFTTYPGHPWQDDTLLSKPNAAYEWLNFHDRLSSKVHIGQEWELAPYLSQTILSFHHLFASPVQKSSWVSDHNRGDEEEEALLPFSGPRADYFASEALKHHKSILQGLQSSLSISLYRCFKSPEDLSSELLPRLIRMLTPDVKPVIMGGSGEQKGVVSVRKECEQRMIQRSVNIMGAIGVSFERVRVDDTNGMGNYIYRMEPALDDLAAFGTASQSGPPPPVRYAIRQALDQEYQKYLVQQRAAARQARFKSGGDDDAIRELQGDKQGGSGGQDSSVSSKPTAAKHDFFGRIVDNSRLVLEPGPKSVTAQQPDLGVPSEDGKVWVSYHEGFSNAVRKPITLEELTRGF